MTMDNTDELEEKVDRLGEQIAELKQMLQDR
jgi:polyhydroxyalkanoate synthesis regulator phasin